MLNRFLRECSAIININNVGEWGFLYHERLDLLL